MTLTPKHELSARPGPGLARHSHRHIPAGDGHEVGRGCGRQAPRSVTQQTPSLHHPPGSVWGARGHSGVASTPAPGFCGRRTSRKERGVQESLGKFRKSFWGVEGARGQLGRRRGPRREGCGLLSSTRSSRVDVQLRRISECARSRGSEAPWPGAVLAVAKGPVWRKSCLFGAGEADGPGWKLGCPPTVPGTRAPGGKPRALGPASPARLPRAQASLC